MNIVKVGDTLQVFGEGLQTFRTLPTGTYEVSFNPMKGFALTERPALERLKKIRFMAFMELK